MELTSETKLALGLTILVGLFALGVLQRRLEARGGYWKDPSINKKGEGVGIGGVLVVVLGLLVALLVLWGVVSALRRGSAVDFLVALLPVAVFGALFIRDRRRD